MHIYICIYSKRIFFIRLMNVICLWIYRISDSSIISAAVISIYIFFFLYIFPSSSFPMRDNWRMNLSSANNIIGLNFSCTFLQQDHSWQPPVYIYIYITLVACQAPWAFKISTRSKRTKYRCLITRADFTENILRISVGVPFFFLPLLVQAQGVWPWCLHRTTHSYITIIITIVLSPVKMLFPPFPPQIYIYLSPNASTIAEILWSKWKRTDFLNA